MWKRKKEREKESQAAPEMLSLAHSQAWAGFMLWRETSLIESALLN